MMIKYTDGGLRNIRLANGYTVKKTPYGEAVAIEDVEGLIRAICLAFTKKKTKLTGAEFRYLRTAMLMSQPALGQNLFGHKDGQTVANWEKTGKLPKHADTLVRLLYTQHVNGNEKVKNLITATNETERAIFCMKRTAKGWGSKEEKLPLEINVANVTAKKGVAPKGAEPVEKEEAEDLCCA